MPDSDEKAQTPQVHLLRDHLDPEDSAEPGALPVHIDLVAVAAEFASLSRRANRSGLDARQRRRWEALRSSLISLGYEREVVQIGLVTRIAS
ncbi:MAG: hypothetical protein NVS2B9_03520 [Myxococcales bacterium]